MGKVDQQVALRRQGREIAGFADAAGQDGAGGGDFLGQHPPHAAGDAGNADFQGHGGGFKI
jgi:hypothetical protein